MENTISPTDIARQALTQLTKQKKPPTPVNFQSAYNEIAGIAATDLSKLLQKVLKEAGKHHTKYMVVERNITPLIENQEWEKLEAQLHQLFNSSGKTKASETSEDNISAEVSAKDSSAIAAKWQSMVLETLDLELIPSLKEQPEAQEKAKALLAEMQQNANEPALTQHAEALKNILLTLEMQRDSQQSINDALLSLLRLMTQSMDELVLEDEWLHSQITVINDIVSKPININTLYDAETSLKDLIQKQMALKPALVNAKDTLKMMVATFVNGLAGMTESTSDYHAKIEGYQQKLSSTEEMGELNTVLETILEDTRAVNLNVQRSREALEEGQKKAIEAEEKIKSLTAELDHISEVAHEDYLTGTLNRRGMDEALEREFSRADRYNTTLSIAMMDIDHFKKLNDTLGHAKGDEALTHFAKVIKDVKRTTDVLARYGGEEFIIILPATKQEDAINVITRVQRELTKNFFMSNEERVLITFSAGVAERVPGEKAESIVPRADAALYEAKHTGRNRVVGAPLNA